jgi:hypothetical protein
MTYEELRQRCVNFSEMHPNNPCNLIDIARHAKRRAIERGNMDKFEELVIELANFIENKRKPKRCSTKNG